MNQKIEGHDSGKSKRVKEEESMGVQLLRYNFRRCTAFEMHFARVIYCI